MLSLADATVYFLISVSICMLAHGVAFLSHFAFYKRCTLAGTILMMLAGLLGIASLGSVIVACMKVIGGIRGLMGTVV